VILAIQLDSTKSSNAILQAYVSISGQPKGPRGKSSRPTRTRRRGGEGGMRRGRGRGGWREEGEREEVRSWLIMFGIDTP